MVVVRRTVLGPLRLRQDPLSFLSKAAQEQGKLVYLGAGPRPIYLVNDPALINHVLRVNHANYAKGPPTDRIKPLFGEGLTTSEGALWQRQRRMILPLFQHKVVIRLAPMITELTSRRLAHWKGRAKRGLPLDVAAEMSDLSRDIMLRALFGKLSREDLAEVTEALKIAVEYVNHRVLAVTELTQLIHIRRNRLANQGLHVLHAFVQRTIDEHRSRSQASSDMLSLLMDLQRPRGNPLMDDEQLRDEALTMLAAGHTTTAAALAWTCVLLARHPEVEEQLRHELRTAVGTHAVTADDLPYLTYLKKVIQEALRLFPPTWSTVRTPLNTDQFEGWHIPARSLLLISPYTMHRSSRFWPAPERFLPERFSGKSAGGEPHTYLPFGGGARMCIGQGLAMLQMQLVMATILKDQGLRLPAEATVVPRADLTLRPLGALMTLKDANLLACPAHSM